MSAPIVQCEHLGKRYRIRHQAAPQYVALRDVIANAARKPLHWLTGNGTASPPSREDFWALRDVSFDIAAGDVVGIIGRNGAGKSTLLKVLSRITEPTEGRLTLHGRVASLLEVGTGFHPELTGRENIFLNGAILGMTRAEIIRKFDDIVSFAGVERFLDTPVKRYSSGMYVRLAFAVAAHLEPEILIVDEVLAVGDAEFQKKCLGKMHEVSRGGRTVLFVSHNMGAIQTLCSRAIWLDQGQVRCDGEASETISRYLAQAGRGDAVTDAKPVPLTDALELRAFDLTPRTIETGEAVTFTLTFSASAPAKLGHVTLLIYSLQEMRLAIVDLRRAGFPRTFAAGDTWSLSGAIHSLPLVEGDYRIGFGYSADGHFEDKLGLIELTVTPRPDPTGHVPWAAPYRGVVELDFTVDAQ
ncbi:MAG TPA: ABC transporter ATP-binding protein [Vicinamibacterales bacterium]